MGDQINWSLAPEGATHHGVETHKFHESWYKFENGSWFCASVESYQTFRCGWYGLGSSTDRTDLTERAK